MQVSPRQAALVSWLIVTTFIGGVLGSHVIPRLLYLHDLAKSNHTASGEVVEVYPRQHCTFKYRFMVGNSSYENIGQSCVIKASGQNITVYFSPHDPQKSVNHDPAALFLNDLIPFVAALVLFPIAAALCACYGHQRRHSHGAGRPRDAD
jgi:hypothetical protein